jgi:multiple sugar transport system permease protein
MTTNYRQQKQLSTAVLYLVIAIVLILIAFPVYWLISTSVKPGIEAATNPPTYIPSRLVFDNYLAVLKSENVKFLVNSLVVAVASTVLTTIMGAMAAYALSKTYLSFTIRRLLMLWILVTRIFPPITTAIPYYVIIKNLGIADTYFALVMTYVSYGLPFVIWLMLGFFQDPRPTLSGLQSSTAAPCGSASGRSSCP